MSIIDKLLNNGAREIDLDTVKNEGSPEEVAEKYGARGWKVQITENSLLFEGKDTRQLLQG